MKRLFFLSAVLLAACVGNAQSTYVPPVRPEASKPAQAQPAGGNSTNAQMRSAQTPSPVQAAGIIQPSTNFLREPKPNEIFSGRLTYSGMAVQIVKARNPLELLNPAAPAQYGSGVDNLVLYPFSGTGPMLKLFSIGF
jgi:hypothetical protein